MKDVILTGIKPTGVAHIGNYLGMIKPAIECQNEKHFSLYFIADYHALNQTKDAVAIKENSYFIASAWLACGLDADKSVFYKQSDIPQIFELVTILSNVTPKGLLNRAHAYKAQVDENINKNQDTDANVNMGLFNYPLLMAADILLFNTKYVPVGIDQKQHIEIARDIAEYFNKTYGETFVLPEPLINKETQLVIGLDGRKMSKSYNNTIPLDLTEDKLKKTIAKIVTDSSAVGDPKGTDNNVYKLYELFADNEQKADFEKLLASGIGWGEAKNKLFELINEKLKPIREKMAMYLSQREMINSMLADGKIKAQEIAQKNLNIIKSKIGVV